jgi:hypothetical protein
MNKFLLVKDNVVLTEHITPVIQRLDSFFAAHKLTAWVTSGLRRPEDQLRIIRNELNRRGLSGDYQQAFEDIGAKIMYEDTEVYAWQPAWSKLLSIGFVVNPPYPAVALMDYFRPGSDKNKKGTMIGDSPHIRGTAFDIGGGKDGVANEAMAIQQAMGNVKGLKGYLIERNNNAIHCDVHQIDMTNFK